jgi:2-dehydro-3-deoxy-L-rhamnonate dehydrogenase (NAD+)
MNNTLNGKVALVTGGGRGIGAAVALRLARQGADVALTYQQDKQSADAVLSQIRATGRQATATQVDSGDPAALVAAVDRAAADLGRLDIVVNNAGITGGSKLTWELTDDDWNRVIACDLTSVFLVSRAAVRLMLRARSGRIINIASIAGKEGNPTLAPYSTAKAGVIGFTKALAKEVATHGILVNAIAPAVIGTDMVKQMSKETVDYLVAKIPMGRVGRPEEVAALVAWLVSDECTFSTGAVYDLSGGRATY